MLKSSPALQAAIADLRAKPRRWLVTGGAGFIGSHLVEFLLRNEQEVRALDNFATGFKENLEDVRLRVGLNARRFNFIEGDIRNPATCLSASRDIDVILHQAALGSVPRSLTDPKATDDTNVGGFLNMLLAAKENRVPRFVFASSSSVYGDSPELPKVETNLGAPLSPYAVSKLANELYARVFASNFAMEIIGLRYFNVFGGRQNPNGPYAAVIPKWIGALLAGDPLTIHGDGSSSRDFCYIENVVQMNILAALTTNSESLGRMYNTACGARTTLNELAEILLENIAARTPKSETGRLKYSEARKGDITHSLASIDLARTYLKYEPLFDFALGLSATLDWYLAPSAIEAR